MLFAIFSGRIQIIIKNTLNIQQFVLLKTRNFGLDFSIKTCVKSMDEQFTRIPYAGSAGDYQKVW
jgi:hypothetical protein